MARDNCILYSLLITTIKRKIAPRARFAGSDINHVCDGFKKETAPWPYILEKKLTKSHITRIHIKFIRRTVFLFLSTLCKFQFSQSVLCQRYSLYCFLLFKSFVSILLLGQAYFAFSLILIHSRTYILGLFPTFNRHVI